MKKAQAVLSVKFNSSLEPDKLLRACQKDLQVFREVPGLIQKYYVAEEFTGALSGIYLFTNKKTRAAFWTSDLAKSIGVRYGVIKETLRVEEYDMAIVLNEVEETVEIDC
jgi:hypothetical protein